jgi:hypothetical protein
MGITRRAEAEYRHWKAEEVKLIGDLAVRFSDVCVHEFTVGDVEDPEIYAAQPIWEWQESDAGKWVMENAVEQPYYIQGLDYNSWGHRYKIMARLSEQNQTFWSLKWGGIKK